MNAQQLFHYLKQFPIEERPKYAPNTPEMEMLNRTRVLLPFCEDYLLVNNRSIETEIVDICCPFNDKISENEIIPLFKERFGRADIFRIISVPEIHSNYYPLFHIIQPIIPERFRHTIVKGNLACSWTKYPTKDTDVCDFYKGSDAVYDIQVRGNNIEQLELQIGETIIETLTEPTEGNLWRFQSFRNFMAPLILLCLPNQEVKLIKKGRNSTELDVKCYSVFYGLPLRREIASDTHIFNIGSSTFRYEDGMGTITHSIEPPLKRQKIN